jgi:hypothetical protein
MPGTHVRPRGRGHLLLSTLLGGLLVLGLAPAADAAPDVPVTGDVLTAVPAVASPEQRVARTTVIAAETRAVRTHRAELRRRAATDRHRIRAARGYGCRMPDLALRASREAGIPFYVGCAFLAQETGGGRNVFGHDASIFAGAGRVTRTKYLHYKRLRRHTGEMQGVGPMQLTWYTLQDRADRLGGCWHPYVNMLVGFRHLASLHRAEGSWHGAARAYNGSGPAADRYATQLSHRLGVGRRVIAA